MGKWVLIIGIVAAVFLYDPSWAMHTVDQWIRAVRAW